MTSQHHDRKWQADTVHSEDMVTLDGEEAFKQVTKWTEEIPTILPSVSDDQQREGLQVELDEIAAELALFAKADLGDDSLLEGILKLYERTEDLREEVMICPKK